MIWWRLCFEEVESFSPSKFFIVSNHLRVDFVCMCAYFYSFYAVADTFQNNPFIWYTERTVLGIFGIFFSAKMSELRTFIAKMREREKKWEREWHWDQLLEGRLALLPQRKNGASKQQFNKVNLWEPIFLNAIVSPLLGIWQTISICVQCSQET